MSSQIAWLNFDADQQRRTQLMMAALAGQGTIDELGLGVIRDLISATLHPGMTVLYTRAKYLLFVPRIYQSLSGLATDGLVVEGRKREARLINALVAHYDEHPDEDRTGIIGRIRGQETRQLASAIYWGLLQGLDILRYPGSLTDYCRHVAEQTVLRGTRSLLRGEDDVDEAIDEVWRELPAPPEDTPVSFELSVDEAEWLRQRFLAREASRPAPARSLTAWLLDDARGEWVTGVQHAWEHPMAEQFPEVTAEAMWLGRDLDRLADGARILYNLLCARGRPRGAKQDELVDRYEQLLDGWYEELHDAGLPDDTRLHQLDAWARMRMAERGTSWPTLARWASTYQFLTAWRRIVADGHDVRDDALGATLVVNREASLKPGRARLQDPALLTGWQGDSGMGRFDYNWAVTGRILTDIHAGLGTPTIPWTAS